MNGDLCRDVRLLFGTFFVERSFVETGYRYDATSFGNEVLDLAGPRRLKVRFARERSIISLGLKKGWLALRYRDAQMLLRQLGADDSHYSALEQGGMRHELVRDIIHNWDRLLALL